MDSTKVQSWAKVNAAVITSIVVLWITIAVTAWISINKNQGYLVYALDDAYIHMSIAKNLALNGVWGINGGMFSSASSSILWTLLVSLIFYCFGTNELVPLVLNIIMATAVLLVVHYILKKYFINGWREGVILLSIVFLTPLPANVFNGMEHLLQILITTSAVYLAAVLLEDPSFRFSQKTALIMLILSSLVTMIRYEGLFVILIICILFLLRHRFLYAVFLGTMGLLPIVIFGLISLRMGWYFLPNSLMIKGSWPEFASFQEALLALGSRIGLLLTSAPHLVFLAALVFAVFHYKYTNDRTFWNRSTIMATIFVGSTILHLSFAGVGWFYRYEAYLVAIGILTLGLAARFDIPGSFEKISLLRAKPTALLMILCLVTLLLRGVSAVSSIPLATANIFQQQYQMGLFLQKYYTGAKVAANDIGIISLNGNIHLLDLVGLADMETAKARRADIYNSEFIYRLAQSRDIEIAMVFDSWFESSGGIPKQWYMAGKWRIPNNIICGDDTVTFYSVRPSGREKLVKSLRDFAKQMPPEVIQSGEYTIGNDTIGQ